MNIPEYHSDLHQDCDSRKDTCCKIKQVEYNREIITEEKKKDVLHFTLLKKMNVPGKSSTSSRFMHNSVSATPTSTNKPFRNMNLNAFTQRAPSTPITSTDNELRQHYKRQSEEETMINQSTEPELIVTSNVFSRNQIQDNKKTVISTTIENQAMKKNLDKREEGVQQEDALTAFLRVLLSEKAESHLCDHAPSSISVYMDNFIDSSRPLTRQALPHRICKTKSLPSRFKNDPRHNSSLVHNRWHNASSSLDDTMILHRRKTQGEWPTTEISSNSVLLHDNSRFS